jgi:hypothetical protein
MRVTDYPKQLKPPKTLPLLILSAAAAQQHHDQSFIAETISILETFALC